MKPTREELAGNLASTHCEDELAAMVVNLLEALEAMSAANPPCSEHEGPNGYARATDCPRCIAAEHASVVLERIRSEA